MDITRTGFLLVFLSLGAMAQDHFTDTVAGSDLVIELEDVVTIPDSSTENPPRLNVMTDDPKGRLFVNDQRGPLYFVDDVNGTVVEYLDLRDFSELDLLSTNEGGFQSFAFHPDFHELNADGYGKLYTIFSSTAKSMTPDFNPGGNNEFHTLLLEWEVADASATVFSPVDSMNPYRIVMRLQQPFGNHNAGLIAFNGSVTKGNSDYGNLYIAIGDGGSGGDPQENGQDLSNPYGAILRIDPLGNDSLNGQYGIVADNVFAGDSDTGTLGEIFCYGLRNPQRFGWDVVTGRMFITDIGQNAVEEIDEGGNGLNFGWDVREGSFTVDGTATPSMVDPVAEYDHTNVVSGLSAITTGNRAITTGEVARGTCVNGLDGNLVLADFPSGLMFLLDVDSDDLDGGQDGLRELKFSDGDGEFYRFLDKVNEVRIDRGLTVSSRADLRFSVNTPGRVFLINKRDGIVRRLKANEEPELSMETNGGGFSLPYNGVLQRSVNLMNWEDLIPQPTDGASLNFNNDTEFYRAIRR